MKSIADLRAIREKARRDLENRERKSPIRIEVAMSTCGITAGARDVVGEIMKILAEKDLANISVTQTGCPGLCFHEPLITIFKPGEERRMYGNIDKEKVRKLIEEDVVNNRPIKEWLVNI